MNQNIIISIIGLYLIYKILFSKEGFALSTGITTVSSSLDLTKYYQVGTRSVSNTVTPSKNGGTECTEYPEIAFKESPPENAVCKGEIKDSYYTFGTSSRQGVNFMPFTFKNSAGQALHPDGGSETPASGTYLRLHDFDPNSPKTWFIMDSEGKIRHYNGGRYDLCVQPFGGLNTGRTDRLILKSDCNIKWALDKDNRLILKDKPGWWVHPEGGNPGARTTLVMWDDNTLSKTQYVPTITPAKPLAF
jgi:hypothetical protein